MTAACNHWSPRT